MLKRIIAAACLVGLSSSAQAAAVTLTVDPSLVSGFSSIGAAVATEVPGNTYVVCAPDDRRDPVHLNVTARHWFDGSPAVRGAAGRGYPLAVRASPARLAPPDAWCRHTAKNCRIGCTATACRVTVCRPFPVRWQNPLDRNRNPDTTIPADGDPAHHAAFGICFQPSTAHFKKGMRLTLPHDVFIAPQGDSA